MIQTANPIRATLTALALFITLGVSACERGSGDAMTEMTETTRAVPPAADLLEVRLGGGMQPLPHSVWLSVCADGQVFGPRGRRRVNPEAARRIIAQVQALGLFDLSQDEFDQRLKDADELDISLRGGTGVCTISLRADDAVLELRLNRPELYAESAIEAAQRFKKAIDLIEKFVTS